MLFSIEHDHENPKDEIHRLATVATVRAKKEKGPRLF